MRELSEHPETVMANLSLSVSVNSIFPAQEVGVSEEPDTTTLTRSVAMPTSAPSGNCKSITLGKQFGLGFVRIWARLVS